MHRVALFLLFASACGGAEASDGGADASARDAALDASSTDAGGVDAGADAGAPDATVDAATDAAPRDAGQATPFELLNREEESCPLSPARCADEWPSSGTMLRFTSRETYGDEQHERLFRVFLPAELSGPAPVWIFLHGGGGDSLQMVDGFKGMELADGTSSLAWNQNDETCVWDPYRPLPSFRGPAGFRCEPAARALQSTVPFIVVLPEGIEDLDGGGHHWADGRVPSPGTGVTAERRDDAGFLDHVVGTLLAGDPRFEVDTTRIYLSGGSNGGMMTQRALCAVGDPAYPNLEQIAAWSVGIATMPLATEEGSHGRTACRDSGPRVQPLLTILGRGIDTPNCRPWGCDDPLVEGDGFIPWGEAGGRYIVASPDGGEVLGAEDSLARWRAYELASGAGEASVTSEPLGVSGFTTRTVHRYVESDVTFEVLVADGGLHLAYGTRFDFNPIGRQWAFLSAHRLVGGEVVLGAPLITGEY